MSGLIKLVILFESLPSVEPIHTSRYLLCAFTGDWSSGGENICSSADDHSFHILCDPEMVWIALRFASAWSSSITLPINTMTG